MFLLFRAKDFWPTEWLARGVPEERLGAEAWQPQAGNGPVDGEVDEYHLYR